MKNYVKNFYITEVYKYITLCCKTNWVCAHRVLDSKLQPPLVFPSRCADSRVPLRSVFQAPIWTASMVIMYHLLKLQSVSPCLRVVAFWAKYTNCILTRSGYRGSFQTQGIFFCLYSKSVYPKNTYLDPKKKL